MYIEGSISSVGVVVRGSVSGGGVRLYDVPCCWVIFLCCCVLLLCGATRDTASLLCGQHTHTHLTDTTTLASKIRDALRIPAHTPVNYVELHDVLGCRKFHGKPLQQGVTEEMMEYIDKLVCAWMWGGVYGFGCMWGFGFMGGWLSNTVLNADLVALVIHNSIPLYTTSSPYTHAPLHTLPGDQACPQCPGTHTKYPGAGRTYPGAGLC